jgi:hypothetical protein
MMMMMTTMMELFQHVGQKAAQPQQSATCFVMFRFVVVVVACTLKNLVLLMIMMWKNIWVRACRYTRNRRTGKKWWPLANTCLGGVADCWIVRKGRRRDGQDVDRRRYYYLTEPGWNLRSLLCTHTN